jgi:ureidoglycolate hydrolase
MKKTIQRGTDRFKDAGYFDIFGLPGEGKTAADPLFTNDLLDFWSPLGALEQSAQGFDIGLCRIKTPFFEFDRMERHLRSVEIIVPLRDDLFIPVAPPGGDVPPSAVRVVQVRVGETIQLHAGAWHYACGALDEKAMPLDYLVLLERGTPTKDLEMVELGETVRILPS